MSATLTREVEAPPAPGASGRPLGWWGMVFAIATEAMLFALLLFGYFHIRAAADAWPPPGIEDPELVKSGIRTVLLLGSTIPIAVAERGVRRGDHKRLVGGLVLALAMASLFLAGHVEEYVHLWGEFRPSTNAYGSAFYTITGLHALHLMVGMALAAFVLRRAVQGRVTERHHTVMGNAALYWHFVDVVWVAVYASLYLSVTLA